MMQDEDVEDDDEEVETLKEVVEYLSSLLWSNIFEMNWVVQDAKLWEPRASDASTKKDGISLPWAPVVAFACCTLLVVGTEYIMERKLQIRSILLVVGCKHGPCIVLIAWIDAVVQLNIIIIRTQ
jgi:hypothetical protein